MRFAFDAIEVKVGLRRIRRRSWSEPIRRDVLLRTTLSSYNTAILGGGRAHLQFALVDG
jgi:hypothetical protein